MKCTGCGYEAGIDKFRYLYNARVDSSISLRQCPKCEEWLGVDEKKQEVVQSVNAGEAPWGKSAGIEGKSDEATVD